MSQKANTLIDQLADALGANMPWRVDTSAEAAGPQGVKDRFIRDANGAIVATASLGPLDDAIARRIVLCVNACAGIDTERLERFSLVEFRESALNVVRNWERGDLAGAVNILEGDAEAIGGSAADGDDEDAPGEDVAVAAEADA